MEDGIWLKTRTRLFPVSAISRVIPLLKIPEGLFQRIGAYRAGLVGAIGTEIRLSDDHIRGGVRARRNGIINKDAVVKFIRHKKMGPVIKEALGIVIRILVRILAVRGALGEKRMAQDERGALIG